MIPDFEYLAEVWALAQSRFGSTAQSARFRAMAMVKPYGYTLADIPALLEQYHASKAGNSAVQPPGIKPREQASVVIEPRTENPHRSHPAVPPAPIAANTPSRSHINSAAQQPSLPEVDARPRAPVATETPAPQPPSPVPPETAPTPEVASTSHGDEAGFGTTRAERRAHVEAILATPEGRDMTLAQIAALTGVVPATVSNIKRRLNID